MDSMGESGWSWLGRRALPLLARAIAGVTVAGAVALGAAPPVAAQTLTDSVTVNATSGLAAIPQGAIGLNTAVYDGDMNDTAIPGLLKAAGIDAMRYPGGSYSDIFNWQTNTAAAGGFVAPGTTFANFMSTAQGVGAAPIVTVNYGTGTPSLAAAWVSNARSSGDNVRFWEVGNEVYGNGTYGADWEADAHCDTSAGGSPVTIGSEPSQTYDCGPGTYAENFLAFQSAMQAADPNAKVCAVLTTPGFWPDGVTNAQNPQGWNQTVLTALGSHTQCVIIHYYPGGSSAAGMLTDPQDIAGIVSSLHSELGRYAGLANPAGVPIIVTETNSTVDLDTQPGALFTADMYMTWLENGAANVDYWNEHNGEATVSTVGGATDFGDQGMFSNGSNGGGTAEPAADTPFAPYYAVELLSKLGAPGDEMVAVASGNALVRVHAVRTAGGALNVLIDNEDPASSYSVGLTYSGFTPSGPPTSYTFAANGTSITSASQTSASSVTVGPYSLTVVHVPGSSGPVTSTSTCAVHYAVNSSWQGGFNASITLTNTGSAATSSWALAFTFPAGESVQSGWDGTWSQSGQLVTVHDAGWNATIPANGGTVGVGFNGNASGAATPPAAFSVNGAACAID